MKATARVTAQKLLNLYRQEHVIVGGWAAVNQVLVTEGTPEVLRELGEMPTGKMLVQHIENLKSGETPMDSIDTDLMPYGGMMVAESVSTIDLDTDEWSELKQALESFTPDQNGLDAFLNVPIVKRFGDEWQVAIRSILGSHPEMLQKWAIVNQTFNAYRLWDVANEILSQPLSERARAQVQADMPEYETYLPMFGDAGDELLAKLRTFTSSMKSEDIQSSSTEVQ